MASGLCSCWTLWAVVLFRTVFADSPYSLPDSQATFDSALQECVPGFLTTFATKQEIGEILSFLSRSASPQGNFTFWVGLKKDKKDCVDIWKPLRGFKWTKTRSEDSEDARWAEEPQSTCTSSLCAALRVELDGSRVIRWGLISVRCKSPLQFICRRTGQTPNPRETSTGLAASEPRPATSEPYPTTPERPNATPDPKLLTQLDVLKPTTGPKQVGGDHGLGSGPAVGSDSCKHPVIPESRSITLDAKDRDRIQVKCWSNHQLDLHCVAHLATWVLPDNSPANLSAICQRCGVGFRKDASANCVDIDECSNGHAHCRHTCLNVEGSYRCVCVDGTGRHHQQDSPACTDLVVEDSGPLSGILIPVLVAVVTLVVLVVVVVVTVKCCLMRKSKENAEKMAMKNEDSERT